MATKERMSSLQLRVLIIEDLHRADAASLDLLARVVEEIARCRLLIVATIPLPPGAAVPRVDTHLPYLLGHRNCERIFIERSPQHPSTRATRPLRGELPFGEQSVISKFH